MVVCSTTRRRTRSAMPRPIRCTAIPTPRCRSGLAPGLERVGADATPAPPREVPPPQERHLRRQQWRGAPGDEGGAARRRPSLEPRPPRGHVIRDCPRRHSAPPKRRVGVRGDLRVEGSGIYRWKFFFNGEKFFLCRMCL